jgi:hypothetical protein
MPNVRKNKKVAIPAAHRIPVIRSTVETLRLTASLATNSDAKTGQLVHLTLKG